MQRKIEHFLDEIKQDMAREHLLLPSLEESASRLKQECERPDTSTHRITELLNQDPAMAVRLLQMANCALYRTELVTDSIPMAINKLGLKLVRDLVINLSEKQLYIPDSNIVYERFRELWIASSKTASLAHMLASSHTELDPDKALLAGLLHNIGAYTVIMMADKDVDLFNNPEALYRLMQKIQGEIGAYILRSWHFPQYLIDVSEQCYNYRRHHEGPADYIDVVQVALLQGSIYTGLDCPEDWSTISAFDRLGIDINSHMFTIDDDTLTFDESRPRYR